jgi:hypothetical protein
MRPQWRPGDSRCQHTHRRRADGEQTGDDRRPSIRGLVGRRDARGSHDEEAAQPGNQCERPQQLDAADPFAVQSPLQGQREQHP